MDPDQTASTGAAEQPDLGLHYLSKTFPNPQMTKQTAFVVGWRKHTQKV